jgi:galactokinase
VTPADALAARFAETYGRPAETVWSAPGRANLIGEHTDYNDGFVLPFALDLRVLVAAARRDDGEVVARSLQRSDDAWLVYPRGVAWALRQLGDVGGADLLVDGRVPLGAGLSSSAALECAVACALAELSGLVLSPVELALACRTAESEVAGVPCGAMDQLASLLCTPGHALFLDTRTLETRQVPLDAEADGLALLLVDTGVQHALAASGYAERRAECERAARELGVDALRDVEAAQLDEALRALDEPALQRRVRHVVTEDARVLACVDLLAAGRARELGPLLTESHRSLRDDFEVSCAEVDDVVDAALQAGALGARMIGGGFGGCVLALADADVRIPGAWRATPSAAARREHTTPEVLR